MPLAKDDQIQVTFRGVSLANEDFNFVPQPSFVVNPRTTFYRFWEAVSAICVFLTCLIVPFQASFEARDVGLWVFVYIFDLMFLADVLLKFRVGYYNKGALVTEKSLVSQRYLRTQFLPDFLTLIPLDLLVYGVQSNLGWYQSLTLLRLNRILRVYRLVSFFGARENELGTNTTLIRALKYAAIGMITIHMISCVWYSMACANEGATTESQIKNAMPCDPDSWAKAINTGTELNVGKRYVLSLYWATATTTSTGYGDLHAMTMGEKWFSIIAMLTGIGLFFGLILGGMASMLTNLDSRRMRYTHHFDVIKDHMLDMKISADIKSRVLAYYEYLWTHNRGESGDGMFSELPLTFQAELSLSINEKVLEKAPLFRGLNPGFRRMLSLVIRPVFYMPNQIISSRGEIGHHMFYIHRGRAEILCENENEVLVTLKEGELFGEVSMVYNLPRSASVRAATPCVVLLLDRVDLNRVLRHYPAVAEQLYIALEHRCDLNNIGSLDTEAGNNKDDFSEMEDDKAEAWLRQREGFKEDSWTKDSLVTRFSRYVIMPDSWFAVIWERLLLSVLLVICFVHTFIASFSVSLHTLGFGEFESVGSKLLMVFTYLLDTVLVADFIMRFNLASRATTEIEDIRKSYRKSLFFWIDLLAILPIEIMALSQDNHHERWHLLAILRLNRLIKAVRIPPFFSNLENNLNYNIGKVRAVKFTIYIILTTHVSACVWFLGSCFGVTCSEESGAHHAGTAHTRAFFDDYIASVYWAAATMSSTGYGDIYAHNMETQLIATVVMLTGLLLYGYCLSSIAATLANSAAPKVEFFARMTAVQVFMAEQNLSQTLMERTETYLAMLWRVHRGEATPGGKRLIEDMPLSLQMDVTYEEAKDSLEKSTKANIVKNLRKLLPTRKKGVPIFMETDPVFLRELSLKVISYLFSPGDYIVYAGDMGREMYCVRRGLVEVIADDDKVSTPFAVISTLGPGDYFGEIGLIFGQSRLATVKAKTFCEILMLTKPDLDDVLANFPIVARQIYDAGMNNEHLKDVRQAAFQSARATVRRLSIKCAGQERSSVVMSSSSPNSKKNKRGRVTPEMSTMQTGLPSVMKEMKEDVNKPYNDLHPILWLFSWLLMRHSISPNSHYFVMWQGFSLVIAGIFTFTLTLQAAFLHTATSLWIINYCFDLLCLVDMYIKFHLAFYNENNVLVTHPLYTARNYLRTNFLLDLLCSFPTDFIVLAIWPESLGVFRILALSRVNRCLYMYKVQQFFHFMTNSIGKNTNLLGQLKVALYMTTFTHCIACGWFLLACKGLENGDHFCTADSWAEQESRKLATKSFGVQYLTSLYWAAATSASVGYGDIHAHNTTEMTFALICMIIGIVLYGYIIASVAAGLANADAQRARYQERLDAIKTFLEEQEISEKLTTRIISYYEYLWLRNKGVDASSLFEGLPLSLQADISVSLYKDMIERVPLFEGTEIGFLKMLSMKVKPVYFLSKEYIVRKGDIGQEMYFIHRGTVEVVSEHEEPIVFDTMGEGRFFGEISVVFSCPRTASIRAQTNSDVFVLMKKDLDEVLGYYPQIRKKILETAEERQRMVAERAKAFAKKKEEDKKREEEDKLKEQEDGNNDQTALTLEVEEPSEPTPTIRQRTLASLRDWKARLADMFVHFVILPESKWRLIKYINCVFVFLTTLTITYMAAFQDHPWYLILFNYLCEFSFYTEIYLNFHMAYTNNIGELISDERRLLINYAKGKLPLDFLASFPIDLFALAAPANEQLFVLSYLRLLHLLRVVRMQQFFSELAKRLNIDVFRVRMTKFFFQLVIVIHVFACAWYYQACPLNECIIDYNWITLEDLLHAPALSRYCTAVYWVVATMTSTGYGDIYPFSSSEMALASFVMVFGKLLFGFILGNIASTLANAEIRRVKYEEKLDAIQAHMSDQDIPEALQNRVMNFYEFIWNKTKGIDHSTLFYDMPLCMNGELCLGMVKDILYAIPLFEKTELPFIRLLSTKVKPAHFHANEYIVRKGDIGQEMFIIRKGLVEVVTEENPPEVIETLEKGDFFGEMFLIHACPQKMSLRAVTHVDMLILSKEDLDALLLQDVNVASQFNCKLT